MPSLHCSVATIKIFKGPTKSSFYHALSASQGGGPVSTKKEVQSFS